MRYFPSPSFFLSLFLPFWDLSVLKPFGGKEPRRPSRVVVVGTGRGPSWGVRYSRAGRVFTWWAASCVESDWADEKGLPMGEGWGAEKEADHIQEAGS